MRCVDPRRADTLAKRAWGRGSIDMSCFADQPTKRLRQGVTQSSPFSRYLDKPNNQPIVEPSDEERVCQTWESRS